LRAWRGDGMSATFAAINRNKRGIAVDLQHPEGARLAFELARRADVVVENFLPGVAERLGLGYQAVSAANLSVIYASVTGFGQTGPHARRAGYNTIAQGMSGIMALTGQPGSPPTKVGGSVADLAAAFLAFGAVNAALVHRLRTGQGQHLDVNLLASTLALLPDPVAHYFDSGTPPPRRGNRNRTRPGDDRRVGEAIRGGAGRRRADLRVRRGVRRPPGQAPRPRGRGRSAGLRTGEDARLPRPRFGDARHDPPPGPSARRAHRRG